MSLHEQGRLDALYARRRRYAEAATTLRTWTKKEGAVSRRVTVSVDLLTPIMELLDALGRGAPEPDTTKTGPMSALLRHIERLPEPGTLRRTGPDTAPM